MKYAVYALLFLIGASTCCPLDCSQVQCVQNFDPFSCPDGTLYSEKAAICGCCPGCVRFKKPREACKGVSNLEFDIRNYFTPRTYVTTGVPPVVQSDDCAPGTACNKGVCSAYIYKCTDPGSGNSKWSPACDVDGSYSAVQCKTNGADHRCFCYNKQGVRIFGTDWMENKDKMKCLCSRLVEKLKTDQDKDKNMDLTFHCSSNGNFEPLQCNRGMCYCADEYTGQPRSFFVPEKLWRVLPCYNNATMGTTYLRRCDSQSNARALILKETVSHGSRPVTYSSPPCDPDGSYYAKQCDGSQCFCRTRDNRNIRAYSTEKGTAPEASQLCYCARDQVIFEEAGRPHPYLCDNGGNYNPLQTIGEEAFCVDSDGFIIDGPLPIAKKCELECVTAAMCSG